MNSFRFQDIVRAVCAVYCIHESELTSQARLVSYHYPRIMVMWIARRHTKNSTTWIGQKLGGRHHTTVMHGEARFPEMIAEHVAIREALWLVYERLTRPAT